MEWERRRRRRGKEGVAKSLSVQVTVQVTVCSQTRAKVGAGVSKVINEWWIHSRRAELDEIEQPMIDRTAQLVFGDPSTLELGKKVTVL